MSSFLIDVPMPSMGATVNELTVIDLKISPGSPVRKGQIIAELESDKSVFEYESPCDGEIVAVRCRAGDIVPSAGPFLRIRTTDASLQHLEAAAGGAEPAPGPASGSTAGKSPTLPAAGSGGTAVAAGSAVAASVAETVLPKVALAAPAVPARVGTGPAWTPRAVKLAQEAGLDPATLTDVPATGPGGRVSGDDFAQYLQRRGSAVAVPVAAPAPAASVAAGTVCIAGVGYAVPRNVRPTSEILKAFPDRTEEEMIKLTGIKERRYAGEDETATSLAVTAVRRALEQSGAALADIDGVIMATIIPDQPVPAMASALARELGIPGVFAFDLNAACSGWLYALEVGRSLISGGAARRVIVVTAELLSRITNPTDHETAFLFGDGAGAAILTNAAGGHRLHRVALSGDATQFAAVQRRGGGALRPFPEPGGKDRADFYLQMNGAMVFKSAVVAFADQIEATLKRHGLRPEDIAWVVPHQANERILRAVSKRVGVPFEKVVMTIDRYGNTSGASVSMALGWAAQEGIFQPGDRIIFCSVGAGLTFAGGLLVW
ncbi:MAG: beta-ketoacyl-ACP synthase 3 [Verrucomicrobia bacterium]|nr:beta-ketoacyl-ACP synthase 3 [Verrucomicrobiota bacterium]